jgi:hypothetical protein
MTRITVTSATPLDYTAKHIASLSALVQNKFIPALIYISHIYSVT